jgi:hypothetical protein
MKIRLPYYGTNRTVPSNKPDITIHDNKKGTCMLINVAIPGDRNVINKEAEKILKYKYLITVIQCMWNVKPKVVSVIIGGTETTSKSFRQYLSNIEESTKLRNYKKLPYWALRTHYGKC